MDPDPAPLVTIITPVKNGGSFIEECILSVATQRYPNIEHIVVDGGSADATIPIVENLQRSGVDVRLIRSRDTSMYEAVNRGLDEAQGQILAYLNADDRYLPWTVSTAVDTIGGGYDLVFGDLLALRSGEFRSLHVHLFGEFDVRRHVHIEPLAQPTVFWQRTLWERLGPFDVDHALLGDCEYWLRAASQGARFGRSREILALQIDHAGTLRSRRRDLLAEELDRLRSDARVPGYSDRWVGVTSRLRWRSRRIRFASARSSGGPWGEFIGFLAENGITRSPSWVLWYLLPGRFRSRDASLVDVDRFLQAIDRELRRGVA